MICGAGYLLRENPATISTKWVLASLKETCCEAIAGKCGGNAASATDLDEPSTPAGTFQFNCGAGYLLRENPATITLTGIDAAAKKETCCAVAKASPTKKNFILVR